jgi:hypothetical protein
MNENDFMLDGARSSEAVFNNGLSLHSPDSLQEFKLITNTFSAEYGAGAGSVLNGVPQSGTNQIHKDDSIWPEVHVLSSTGA